MKPFYCVFYTLDGNALSVTMPTPQAARNVCQTLRRAGATAIRTITIHRTL